MKEKVLKFLDPEVDEMMDQYFAHSGKKRTDYDLVVKYKQDGSQDYFLENCKNAKDRVFLTTIKNTDSEVARPPVTEKPVEETQKVAWNGDRLPTEINLSAFRPDMMDLVMKMRNKA